jgi:hypothetical protein
MMTTETLERLAGTNEPKNAGVRSAWNGFGTIAQKQSQLFEITQKSMERFGGTHTFLKCAFRSTPILRGFGGFFLQESQERRP